MALPLEPPIPVDIPGDVPEGTVTRVPFGRQPIPIPGFIPPLDPVHHIIAASPLNPSWSDVWGWTKSAAGTVLGWFDSPPSVSEALVQRIVEAYVGEAQKAWSTFVNDAVDFAAFG